MFSLLGFPPFASFIRRTSECGGKRDISFYNHSWWPRQSVFASVICLHLCCLEIIQFLLAFLFLACFAFTWQMLPTLSPRLKPFHLTGRRQLPSPPPHHPRKKKPTLLQALFWNVIGWFSSWQLFSLLCAGLVIDVCAFVSNARRKCKSVFFLDNRLDDQDKGRSLAKEIHKHLV